MSEQSMALFSLQRTPSNDGNKTQEGGKQTDKGLDNNSSRRVLCFSESSLQRQQQHNNGQSSDSRLQTTAVTPNASTTKHPLSKPLTSSPLQGYHKLHEAQEMLNKSEGNQQRDMAALHARLAREITALQEELQHAREAAKPPELLPCARRNVGCPGHLPLGATGNAKYCSSPCKKAAQVDQRHAYRKRKREAEKKAKTAQAEQAGAPAEMESANARVRELETQLAKAQALHEELLQEQQDACLICLEALSRDTGAVATPSECGHPFHLECILSWYGTWYTERQREPTSQEQCVLPPCPGCNRPSPQLMAQHRESGRTITRVYTQNKSGQWKEWEEADGYQGEDRERSIFERDQRAIARAARSDSSSSSSSVVCAYCEKECANERGRGVHYRWCKVRASFPPSL